MRSLEEYEPDAESEAEPEAEPDPDTLPDMEIEPLTEVEPIPEEEAEPLESILAFCTFSGTGAELGDSLLLSCEDVSGLL